jgi:exopolyphosphatase/guanosine-5'-triphosphate,3'-diphosphate pyrophosphatase
LADKDSDSSLARFGVIDIGSNTVRLVIFDGRTRSPGYFYNEKETCTLGAEIEETGALYPAGKTRALAAMRRFKSLTRAMKVETLHAVATAAVRDASDGPAFVKQIKKECGLDVRVLSGVEEGRYAAMGVLLGENRKDTVVADIGGASMELTTITKREIGAANSTPLGPLRLSSTGLSGDELDAYILDHIARNWPEDAPDNGRVTLVGGGWRAFAALDMHRRDYPLSVLQGYEMTPEDALKTAEWTLKASESELADAGLSKTRLTNAPLTAQVLKNLIAHANPSVLAISAYGLREGVLFENLPKRLIASDPLIQSAAFQERNWARFPGFGLELAAWLLPLFPDLPERRIVAACLLADVNWRVHPDYRAKACFLTVTQANLGGLTHGERVFLGIALAYRYKGAKDALKSEPATALVSDEERMQAEALGRTIRLGSMVSGTAPQILARSTLTRDDTAITLTVDESDAMLLAGSVERRLASLASALGLEPVIAS